MACRAPYLAALPRCQKIYISKHHDRLSSLGPVPSRPKTNSTQNLPILRTHMDGSGHFQRRSPERPR